MAGQAKTALAPALTPREGTPSIQQGQEIRCYRCCSPDIKNVCCFCGRFLCEKCGTKGHIWMRQTCAAALPKSGERSGAIYCNEHSPRIPSVAGLVGILLLFAGAAAGLASNPLAFIFIGIAVPCLQLRRRIDRMLLGLTPVEKLIYGVLPRYLIDIAGAAQADFCLGTSPDYVTVGAVHGSVTVAVKLDDDESERWSKAKQHPPESLHAGFIAVSTTSDVSTDTFAADRAADTAKGLIGPIPVTFASSATLTRPIGQVASFSMPLQCRASAQSYPVPFRVLPSNSMSALNSNTWGLEFHVERGETGRVMIKELVIDVPPELKSVQDTNGLFEPETSRVIWRDVAIGPDRPASIFVEFDRPIQSVSAVRGRYTAELRGSILSAIQIDPGRLWFPNGRAASPERVSIKRAVSLAGSIEAATRVQPKRLEVIARRTVTLRGQPLTISVAHTIISALTASDVYTKDVSENPSVLSPYEALGVLSRSWEIVGRSYLDHQPYDVHVVILGRDDTSGNRDSVSEQRPVLPDVEIEFVVRSSPEIQHADTDRQRVNGLIDLLVSEVSKAAEQAP